MIPNDRAFQKPVMRSRQSTKLCISPKYVPGDRPSSSTPTMYPPKMPTTSKMPVMRGKVTSPATTAGTTR